VLVLGCVELVTSSIRPRTQKSVPWVSIRPRTQKSVPWVSIRPRTQKRVPWVCFWTRCHHLCRVGNLSILRRERCCTPVTRPHEPRQVDVSAGSKLVDRKITPRLGSAAHNLPIVAAAVCKPLDSQVPTWQPGE